MGLLRLAAIGGIGYAVWKAISGSGGKLQHAGFAPGESDGANFAKVRTAGPEGMRSNPPEWDKTDQAMDESFPASDPPATY
ncbi:hypothetical protein ACFO0A_03455 [Novosphingobium tardum]|uniref:Uncharacterized protein n=1 Tax=Novosphingobium tardum TaxID=1538021 RepID=A0ABV8RL54_9SPHN